MTKTSEILIEMRRGDTVMRKDTIKVFALCVVLLVITIAAAFVRVSEIIEESKVTFTVSDVEPVFTAAGVLTVLFGIATAVSFIVALSMCSDDKEYDESLKNNSDLCNFK